MSPVAVVTGAARGIGAAVVDELVAVGWSVVALDRCEDVAGIGYPMATREDLSAVAARHGDRVVAVVGDARDPADVSRALAAATELGGLDAAVAAAGAIGGGVPMWESTDQLRDAVVSVNFEGVRQLFRASVPALLSRPAPRDGRLVAVSSAAGLVGLRHLADYCAAKHAVLGLVRGLACDLAGTGVTANAVCPGSTRTEMLEASAALYGLEDPEAFVAHQPLGRLLEPREPAALVAWLCSPAASGVTGAALAVDGGMTAS